MLDELLNWNIHELAVSFWPPPRPGFQPSFTLMKPKKIASWKMHQGPPEKWTNKKYPNWPTVFTIAVQTNFCLASGIWKVPTIHRRECHWLWNGILRFSPFYSGNPSNQERSKIIIIIKKRENFMSIFIHPPKNFQGDASTRSVNSFHFW
jgi:hypothetical protein